MDIRDFEEKEIFLLGSKEMYLYLKDVGLIKEKWLIFRKIYYRIDGKVRKT